MILLAIDCSTNLCAACVYDTATNRELGRTVLDLGKGHAERLIAAIEAALKAADKGYADLGAVAVSIGPGSFTGIRVAVSAARGFALALRIPAIGVSTLEALAAQARDTGGAKTVMVALGVAPAAEDSIQAAVYDEFGHEAYAPAIMTLRGATELAFETGALLAGTAAASVDGLSKDRLAVLSEAATADIAVYARLAAAKAEQGLSAKPSPLYLREPDAKPQAGFVLPRRPE